MDVLKLGHRHKVGQLRYIRWYVMRSLRLGDIDRSATVWLSMGAESGGVECGGRGRPDMATERLASLSGQIRQGRFGIVAVDPVLGRGRWHWSGQVITFRRACCAALIVWTTLWD